MVSRSVNKAPQAMLLYHSFYRLTVDTGLPCGAPHMAIVTL